MSLEFDGTLDLGRFVLDVAFAAGQRPFGLGLGEEVPNGGLDQEEVDGGEADQDERR